MAEIMTTKEVAAYLKLHEITICKYAAQGNIPAIRIGRVWRFDKEELDRWITGSPVEKTAKKTNPPVERTTRKTKPKTRK